MPEFPGQFAAEQAAGVAAAIDSRLMVIGLKRPSFDNRVIWLTIAFAGLSLGAGEAVDSDEPPTVSGQVTTVTMELQSPDALDGLDRAVLGLIRQHLQRLKGDPESAALHGELGLVFEANLLWHQARDLFAKAVQMEPSNLIWLYHLGITTWEVGELEEARRLLQQVASQEPTHMAAQQRLGLALLELGQRDSADEVFRKMTEAEPRVAAGWIGLGESLLQQGLNRQAAAALERSLELDPTQRTAHYQLGLAYRGLGRLDDAERELRLGVDASYPYLPDSASQKLLTYAVHLTARIDRAAALLNSGQAEQAAQILEQCLQSEPDNLTILNDLAVAYLRLGRLEEARMLLDRARVLSDRRFSTYINLSSWALRSGDPTEALRFADAAVERGPDRAAPYATRARILFGLERLPAAAESLARAASLDPWNPQFRLAQAGLYRQLGDNERALEYFGLVSERWPQFLVAHLGRAEVALELGRTEEAALAVLAAEELNPDHPTVIDLRRRLDGGEETPAE